MTKRVKNLKHLQSEIDSALSLITQKGESLDNVAVPQKGLIAGTESLLERCQRVVKNKKDEKPVLRVIHHLACSGGTIFSKCIASMPNVFLLSEAHPYSPIISKDNPKFSPTDIPSLAKFAQVPNIEKVSEEIFVNNIKTLNEYIAQSGGQLVVRYHSHSDYNTQSDIPEENRFKALMSNYFDVKQVLTIRDPIDAFTSLQKNGWVHFEPQTFDEYCHRYLIHLNHFGTDEIIRYEDFVDSPADVMQLACEKLGLEFDDSFEFTLGLNRLTGDSGRSSENISLRERKASPELMIESENSEHYLSIRQGKWY